MGIFPTVCSWGIWAIRRVLYGDLLPPFECAVSSPREVGCGGWALWKWDARYRRMVRPALKVAGRNRLVSPAGRCDGELRSRANLAKLLAPDQTGRGANRMARIELSSVPCERSLSRVSGGKPELVRKSTRAPGAIWSYDAGRPSRCRRSEICLNGAVS